MRIESSVTSLSWIPREAISGTMALPLKIGLAHYDPPPPEFLTDLEELRSDDRFRFANELAAFIEVEDGRIVASGHLGGGQIGSTTLRLGSQQMTFPAVPFPDMQPEPEVEDGRVRFVQTAGGRTGVPMPRPVSRPPFFQVTAPIAWSTLALTIHADGSSERELVGASPFPRHWVYDDVGTLIAKTGVIDFKTWSKTAFGEGTPWGDHDSEAVVMAVESSIERRLSSVILGGAIETGRRKLEPGEALVEQGQTGDELYLLFDGVLSVEVDGEAVAEVGPGAILGEQALLRDGRRMATLRAVTPCRVVVVPGEAIDRDALVKVSEARGLEPA